MKTLLTLLLSLLAAGSLFSADEKAAGPQEFVHRVTGLFDRAREDELKAVMEKLPEIELVRLDFESAEGTFRYDQKKTFNAKTLAEATQRLNERLRAASIGNFGVKPMSETPREKLTRIEIGITGLDCRGCSYGLYEIVAKVEGVEQATVSFHDGKISALIDPSKTDRAKLEALLKERKIDLK